MLGTRKRFARLKSRLIKKTAQYFYPYRRFYIEKQCPIIIYQMGKVGSSTIYRTLSNTVERPVFQIHTMNPTKLRSLFSRYAEIKQPIPEHLQQGQMLFKHIIRRKYPAQYITLVREPIARAISAFFENYSYFPDQNFNADRESLAINTDLVLKHADFPHALHWFDNEFKVVLNLDIYDYPFSHQQGFTRIQNDHIDLLVLRIEDDDNIIETAIKDFLNLPQLTLKQDNISAEKSYADTYRNVREDIILPMDLVNQMLDSKYTRHFYTEAEREHVREKWQSRLSS